MTKKCLTLVAVLAITVMIIGVPALLSLLPHPDVTKSNFDRIKTGMTRMEVEEVFGEKGTNVFDTARVQFVTWEANDGSRAEIEFVDDGAIPKRWVDNGETFLDRIRRWLGLGAARPKPAMRTGP
ncbi:MAG: hypothetical protein EXS16_09515 [Gemmataceae bacterium]|nr:hypothetical protein [Gemmataceae bacterium]